MRPRVFPAEDARHARPRPRDPQSFNEAAGIPRGRLGLGELAAFLYARFNEAAGIPRGRRQPVGTVVDGAEKLQ